MFFDAADIDSEDEEEILEEFMMAHSEQAHCTHIASLNSGRIHISNILMRSSGRKKEVEMHTGWTGVFNSKYHASTFSEKV